MTPGDPYYLSPRVVDTRICNSITPYVIVGAGDRLVVKKRSNGQQMFMQYRKVHTAKRALNIVLAYLPDARITNAGAVR